MLLWLSVLWLALGALLGLLALAARLRPEGWRRSALVALGAAGGLAGGWLGTLVYGRYFGTGTALWVGVLAVWLGPWLIARVRFRSRQQSPRP
jgi:hypothetical protein